MLASVFVYHTLTHNTHNTHTTHQSTDSTSADRAWCYDFVVVTGYFVVDDVVVTGYFVVS